MKKERILTMERDLGADATRSGDDPRLAGLEPSFDARVESTQVVYGFIVDLNSVIHDVERRATITSELTLIGSPSELLLRT